jgi:hypothetical protein
MADFRELELECALSDALVGGVREPSVLLDSIVAHFVSGNYAATAVINGRS